MQRDTVFSLPGPGLGLRGKTGIRFCQHAVGGRLQLTLDDLVRCERALSNLEGNKLEVIFYETSVPSCLKAPLSLLLCTVSPTDVFIKSAAVAHKHTLTHTLTHTHERGRERNMRKHPDLTKQWHA